MEKKDNEQPREQLPYEPCNVINTTMKTGLIGGGVGLFAAAVRNALSRQNVGAMAVFTRNASVVGICAAAPATYAFCSRAMMNLREKNDVWPYAFGGFMAGSVAGLPSRRLPVVAGLGATVSIVHAALFLSSIRSPNPVNEIEDEFERKEIIRRTTRVPVEQTIAEIGEGRGFYPPGYEERRRERIKEKYGFEIKPVSASLEGSK